MHCQGTFNFKGSNMLLFLPLCTISQGLCVPYQFLEYRKEQSCMQLSGLRSWERAPAWIPFSYSLQWLSSVTFYLKDYPFCCNWWNFILNGWVIILLKIYKHAFLQIKYACFIRDLGPPCPFLHLLFVDSSPQVLVCKDHNKWRPNRDLNTLVKRMEWLWTYGGR